jgi:hypothetical protein
MIGWFKNADMTTAPSHSADIRNRGTTGNPLPVISATHNPNVDSPDERIPQSRSDHGEIQAPSYPAASIASNVPS